MLLLRQNLVKVVVPRLLLTTEIAIALLVFDADNISYQSQEVIEDKDLYRLLVNKLKLTKPLPRKPSPPPPPTLITQTTKTGTWRIGAVKHSIRFPPEDFQNRNRRDAEYAEERTRERNIQIAIAVNLEVVDREMATINNIFLISIPGVLLLIAIGAWLLSGSVLSPINQLTSEIQLLSAKGLDRRIPLEKTDVEFVELIRVFNQMLERLERSFHQASRFSGDAAHELKTPLTILQGELERTLQQVTSGSEVQQRLSYLLDQLARNRKIEGIGLGLSLAREIVRAHHGELMLDAALEGETSFTVSLPMVL